MNKIIVTLFCVIVFYVTGEAQSVYPGQHEGKITLPLQGEIKVYAFDLKMYACSIHRSSKIWSVYRNGSCRWGQTGCYIASVLRRRVCRAWGDIFHKEIGRMGVARL